MEIRIADAVRDRSAIVECALKFSCQTDLQEILPKTQAGMDQALERVIELDGFNAVLAINDGKIVGGLGLLFSPFVWNPELLACEEVFLWCRDDAPPSTLLRLLRFAGGLAEENGADICIFSSLSTSPPSLARLYQRLGLHPFQASFIGEI